MSHLRYSRRILVASLALAALLIAVLTLVVVAQGPDNPGISVVQEPGDRDASVPPDQVTVVEEPELLADPSSPSVTGYYFKFLSANSFATYTDDMTFEYDGGGCIYRTGGYPYTNHSLELPQGAEIKYLRIYYDDNDDAYNAGALIQAYDGSGSTTEIVRVESSGTPGQDAKSSEQVSYSVDNSSEALVVSLFYGYTGTSDLTICGVRIMYKYTPTIADLPLILNGFGP